MSHTEASTKRRAVTRPREKSAQTKTELGLEVERLERKLKRLVTQVANHERARETESRTAERIRRQGSVLAELAKSDELASEDLSAFIRLATERAAETLGVERVGIWFFRAERSLLCCEHLYEASFRRHGRGAELEARRFPKYFAALSRGRILAANDACRDAATREFCDSYLAPLGIGAMLDAPLRRGGRLIGAVCHEHVGPPRTWLPEEEEFAASVAEFVALALESNERRRAEEAFRLAHGELLRQKQQEKQVVEDELARLQEDLVRHTRLATVGQVAASIAHELRNPLGAVRNAAYLLRRRGPTLKAKWEQYLDIMEHEIRQADRILGDLLEMSRAKTPSKADVDLARLAKEAMDYVGNSSDVVLELNITPDPYAVFADEGQLRQVLANLFTNSVQALNGEPGRITVSASKAGGFDRLLVGDTGPGVPAAVRRQIFEPLFSTKAKGTGLGLAICRQILEGHGGSIDLTDSPAGSLFCIHLPPHPVA